MTVQMAMPTSQKWSRTHHPLICSWEPGGGGLNRISNNPIQQSCSYLSSPQLRNWGLERMTDMSMLIQQMQEKAFSLSPLPRPSPNLFSETEEGEWNPGGGVLLWAAQVRLCEPKPVIHRVHWLPWQAIGTRLQTQGQLSFFCGDLIWSPHLT